MKRDTMNGGGMCGGVAAACYVYPGAPATPGLVNNPDAVFQRGIYMNGSITMDDGNVITVWGFPDLAVNNGMDKPFPSPAIRVREGDVVHTELTVQGNMWVHTIHHHGIEPAWQNDGVGHISWDVDGTYTYQWRAHQAGTYFYHCHTNTVLHAEMGMYGLIVVDPQPDPNDPPGTRRVFAGGPTYDVEAFWVCDEIDSSWHTKCWDAGTCGGDAGLNDLNPDYFIITGVDGAQSALTDPRVAVDMNAGQTLLVRYLAAGYYPQRITFGGLTATVVASDGRPFPNAVQMDHIDAVAAERYDCLLTPTTPGTYEVTVEFLHWVTGAVLGTARTRINVT